MKPIKSLRKTKKGGYYLAYLKIPIQDEYIKLVGDTEFSTLNEFIDTGFTIFRIEKKRIFRNPIISIFKEFSFHSKSEDGIRLYKQIPYLHSTPQISFRIIINGEIFELSEMEIYNHILLEDI